MGNGSATPRGEGFAKQTQVMLLGGWYAKDVSQEPGAGRRSQEPWLRRYSWKKGAPNLYSFFLLGLVDELAFSNLPRRAI